MTDVNSKILDQAEPKKENKNSMFNNREKHRYIYSYTIFRKKQKAFDM